MAKRDLTTTREQVFGDVEPGTECRICGRDVDDGRSKTCSEFCGNLLSAVMGMLNWSELRRRIIERDDKTCQSCGYDRRRDQQARRHIQALVEERAGDRPEPPDIEDRDESFDWDAYYDRVERWRKRREQMKARYGDPYEAGRGLEVDHITPIADGGHPFDPGNLQTLCSQCHSEKTAAENSQRTPTRGDLSESLLDYVTDGGEADE